MKGSIKKDKNTGLFYYVVDIGKEPITGKRRQKKKRGFKSKEEAEVALAKLISNSRQSTAVSQSNMTLNEYMIQWFIERKNKVERTTYNNNKAFFKYYISPALGCIKLSDMSPILLQNFANNLTAKGNLSAGTIHKIFDVLKVVFQRAVIFKLISENYAKYVELPKLRKKEMNVWDLDQVNYFLSEIKEIRKADFYYTAYIIALLTGMRQGEILGLRWKDVSFNKKLIYIRQVLTHDGKELRLGTKTIAGLRTISISDTLCEHLQKTKNDIKELKRIYGKKFQDNDLVICTKKGSPVNSSNLIRAFKKDIQKVGLPIIRFHDTRHTHATMLIEQNINPKLISERLGHARIGITLDIYSHVLPSMQQQVADKLDEMISL
ncbi:site-specific integrase [Bacillus sp. JJ1503]|uniref:site-specific integrase n=1 Tax=Bacillus sp. JJ1503 TaxID=3122956 RepID=UPI002FFE70FB